jgi:hypothetical protein
MDGRKLVGKQLKQGLDSRNGMTVAGEYVVIGQERNQDQLRGYKVEAIQGTRSWFLVTFLKLWCMYHPWS